VARCVLAETSAGRCATVRFLESSRGLLYVPVGGLAILSADRYPQVSALWSAIDDGALKLSLNTTRKKTKNLRRHAECTLVLLDLATPYRTIDIRARVEISTDNASNVFGKVEHEYGVDVRKTDCPDEDRVAVMLHPVKIDI
jgi:pyridoxamine 5'-phosphate oxidase-like protein